MKVISIHCPECDSILEMTVLPLTGQVIYIWYCHECGWRSV